MVTKEILKNAIETKWRKYQRNIYLIIGFVIIFFMILYIIPVTFSDDFSSEVFGITCLSLSPLFIVLLSFFIYYQIAYKKACTVLDDYSIYETILDHPSPSYMYKHSFYYAITFVTKEGDTISVDTPGMFGNGFLGPNSIEEYNNQKVYVAYSKKNDRTIILGKSITEDN